MKRTCKFMGGLALVLALGLAATTGLAAADKKEYKVFIVSDTLRAKFQDAQDGFKATLDKLLATEGAKASYTVFDTKTDPATVPGIIKAIQDGQPDLICTINNPGVFADTNITLKLKDPKYRFVSENCIPVQSGAAREWKKPGGNVTGVGVFLQFNSPIRLAKMIKPGVKRMAFVTWKAMDQLNQWFETELASACRQEGIELLEFRRVTCVEDELAFFKEYDSKSADTFVMCGISAYVHRDGSPADVAKIEPAFMREQIKRQLFITYDEVVVAVAAVAGTCVVWNDIGAQLGEKGYQVLKGKNPGDIAWDYPRRYNVMLNRQIAKDRGISLPQDLVSAAYRVYTDYEGNFVKGN